MLLCMVILPALPLFVYNNIYVAACIFVHQECCTSMPYTFLHVFVCWRGCEYVHQVTISPSKALLVVFRSNLYFMLQQALHMTMAGRHPQGASALFGQAYRQRITENLIYTRPDICFSHPKIQTCHQIILGQTEGLCGVNAMALNSGKCIHSRRRDYIMSLQGSSTAP